MLKHEDQSATQQQEVRDITRRTTGTQMDSTKQSSQDRSRRSTTSTQEILQDTTQSTPKMADNVRA